MGIIIGILILGSLKGGGLLIFGLANLICPGTGACGLPIAPDFGPLTEPPDNGPNPCL